MKTEMNHRPWIFKPSLLAAVLAALAAYSLVAEIVDFHLLGLRLPSASALNHRLWECMILWLVVCSVVGWTLYFRKRRPPRESALWPLLAVPLVIALWLSAAEGWDMYLDHVDRVNRSIPATSFWFDIGIPLIGVALPFGLWAAIAVVLVPHAKVWRRSVTVGICPICEYDLTGNESGVCPECGTRVVMDPDIPHYFYQRRFTWLPELCDFPDAEARFEASRQAGREYRRSPIAWASSVLALLAAASFTPYASKYLGGLQWVAVPVLVIAVLTATWIGRGTMRRSLRTQLARQRKGRETGPSREQQDE
jgi:hypothetical protein